MTLKLVLECYIDAECEDGSLRRRTAAATLTFNPEWVCLEPDVKKIIGRMPHAIRIVHFEHLESGNYAAIL